MIYPRLPASAADGAGASPNTRSPAARLDEAVGLAEALDLEIVGQGIVNVTRIRPSTLIGAGKVDELAGLVRAERAELVVVDGQLSPVQQRNLERAWNAKVLDRTGLILEIFGARAKTREGRLQVELAHLTYQRSRLVRSWTHLERQRGALGFVGGPGETQIEADRRLIQERITALQAELRSVIRTRALHRESRARVPYPIVALVGYTNAGKSTLFNRLTRAGVSAEDLLFATLDPTMRQIELGHGRKVIVSDTVGFISDLPTHLVAAFRATLEEVTSADLILHVRDISHDDSAAQAEDVGAVLATLWGDKPPAPVIEVWNKIDALDASARAALTGRAAAREDAVAVSATTGQGIETLLEVVEIALAGHSTPMIIVVDAARGREINWIYENCEVLGRREISDGNIELDLRVPPAKEALLARRLGRASPSSA